MGPSLREVSNIAFNFAPNDDGNATQVFTPKFVQLPALTSSNSVATTPYALHVGTGNTSWAGIPLPFSLAGLGAPGRSLLVAFPLALTGTTSFSGTASIFASVPNDLQLYGLTFHAQMALLDFFANNLGVVIANGGSTTFGCPPQMTHLTATGILNATSGSTYGYDGTVCVWQSQVEGRGRGRGRASRGRPSSSAARSQEPRNEASTRRIDWPGSGSVPARSRALPSGRSRRGYVCRRTRPWPRCPPEIGRAVQEYPMRISASTLRAASVVSLAALASAQQPEDAPASAMPPPPRAQVAIPRATAAVEPASTTPSMEQSQLLGGDLFTAPIRSGEDDLGYRYGTWASGPSYKVSFHEGFAFYPVLGAAYERNLPLAWRTTSVTLGDAELLRTDESPKHRASDWRYEYRFSGFTEAYDVRPDGVEQTFVFPAPLASGGDLVVRGRVTTELRAAARAAEHGAIEFLGPRGESIARYGAAHAIDARGAVVPVPASWDGEQLSLTIPAAWLADAHYPVTLDPLIGSTIVAFDTSNRQASNPDVARDDEANQLLVVYGRLNSGGDYDLFARLTDEDFGGTTTVFNDLTASWSTRNGDVGIVAGANRWVIALQRDFPSPTGSWIRAHVHDSADTTLLTTWVGVAGSNGNSLTVPDVGGTAGFSAGDNALIVYQSDLGLTNTTTSEVYAVLFNATTSTPGTPFSLEVGTTFDRESPSVNQESDGGTSSWITCWPQLDNAINEDDWDLIIRRIDSTGVSQGRSFLGNSSATVHAYRPRIAGRFGRYLASYGEAPNAAGAQLNGSAPQIWVQRFDWSEASPTAVTYERKLVRASRTEEFWNGNAAHDSSTDSHWGIAYHSTSWDVYAERIGYDGGICESVVVYDTASLAFSPSITFNDDLNNFPIVFTANEFGTQPFPVYGVRFTYPTFNQPAPYGTGCGPAILGSNSNLHSRKPHSGAEFFEISVSSAPNNAAGLLILGVNPVDLPIPGYPGCHLHVGTPIVYLPLNATGSTATLSAPIPSGISGVVYLEWLYVNIAAPGGLQMTRGLEIQVR